MKKVVQVFVILLVLCLWAISSEATSIFINEIHYDNVKRDAGEGIEIAGLAGVSLTGWSVVFYNGRNGQQYGRLSLSGTFSDQENGVGALSFLFPNIQNGKRGMDGYGDGMALVDSNDAVVQFLSYEGSFRATNGPADGLTSIDIGVSENRRTPVGHSLQLVGIGSVYEDFTWATHMESSYGEINNGQSIVTPVPEPSTVLMLTTGMVGLLVYRKRFFKGENYVTK